MAQDNKRKIDLSWLKGNNNLLLLLVTAGTLFLDNVEVIGQWKVPLKAILIVILFGMNAKILYNDYQKSKQEEKGAEKRTLILGIVSYNKTA